MARTMNGAGDFLNLDKQVQDIPILVKIGTVVPVYATRYGEQIPESDLSAYRRNAFMYATALGRPDEHLGSTVITPSKNMYWDFGGTSDLCNWSGTDFEQRHFGFWPASWDRFSDQADGLYPIRYALRHTKGKDREEAVAEKLHQPLKVVKEVNTAMNAAYVQAVYHLAWRFKLISGDEYRRLLKNRVDDAVVTRRLDTLVRPEVRHTERRADIRCQTSLYAMAARAAGLSEEDKAYLLNERHVPEKNLRDYFTFPERRTFDPRTKQFYFVENTFRELAEGMARKKYGCGTDGLTKEQKEAVLNGPTAKKVLAEAKFVPGLYQDEQNRLNFMPHAGIGYLARNDRGEIHGVGIRNQTIESSREGKAVMHALRKLGYEEKTAEKKFEALTDLVRDTDSLHAFKEAVLAETDGHALLGGIGISLTESFYNRVRRDPPRYTWWTSGWAQSQPGCEGGNSPGAPGGVLFPETNRDKAGIVITEGRFKAEQLALHGSIAIYVSGVGNWRAVMPMLDRLKGARKRVYIAYDADLMGNPAVHQQLRALAQGCGEHGLTPVMLVWSKAYGKGFDDLVENRGADFGKYVKAVYVDDFENKYREALNEVLARYGASSMENVPKEQARAFREDLQTMVERKAGVIRPEA